jgi:hypothetical protein
MARPLKRLVGDDVALADRLKPKFGRYWDAV